MLHFLATPSYELLWKCLYYIFDISLIALSDQTTATSIYLHVLSTIWETLTCKHIWFIHHHLVQDWTYPSEAPIISATIRVWLTSSLLVHNLLNNYIYAHYIRTIIADHNIMLFCITYVVYQLINRNIKMSSLLHFSIFPSLIHLEYVQLCILYINQKLFINI